MGGASPPTMPPWVELFASSSMARAEAAATAEVLLRLALGVLGAVAAAVASAAETLGVVFRGAIWCLVPL